MTAVWRKLILFGAVAAFVVALVVSIFSLNAAFWVFWVGFLLLLAMGVWGATMSDSRKAKLAAETEARDARRAKERAESRKRSDARKHEKDEARREKVMTALAPYVFDGEEIAYLVKFKQGEEIFTDYLAVTPKSLLIVTGLIATPDV
jgi:uncharacterized protein YacL